jgi:hypothetical protein
MQIQGTQQFELKGRGLLQISQNDHVATGGQGSVYRPGNSRTIVKLYTDPKQMISEGLHEKLALLSQIRYPYIVAPTDLVFYKGNPVGYYMPFVSGEALPRIFSNAWRQQTGFDDKATRILVDRMRETVQFAHDSRAIMVDANELNWLAYLKKKDEPEPRAIDVDAWQIDRWPATVIMPSIRDWHTKGFNEMTDWFSWGIVAFQLFTGIHPYRGGLDGYKPSEMEKRMKENASVFTSGIRLNKAVRDFNTIPGPLLDWCVATFSEGKRMKPPSPFATGRTMAKVTKIARTVVTATGALVYEKLFGDISDPAVKVFSCGAVFLQSGALIDLKTNRRFSTAKSHKCEVVRKNEGWIKADYNNGNLEVSYIDAATFRETQMDLRLIGRRFVRYENRLFVVVEKGITEITVKIFGQNPTVVHGNTWGAIVNSTKWFDGVGILDAMGAKFVIAPFGEENCIQVRVKELDDFHPVAAKAGERFVVVIGIDNNGQYKKIELTFDREYKSYAVWEGMTDSPEINMAMLPKGVVAIITEDGELNIFVPVNGQLKQVSDSQISTEMNLADWGNQVVYTQDGAVWSLKMR